MKIVQEFPPIYSEISARFNIKGKAVVFTYGDTIYNPQGVELPDHLIKHEEVHEKQQTNPAEWWKKYLEDPQFRLEQEVEAYQVQYQFIKENYSRPVRRAELTRIAKDLSGIMYGNIITYEQARDKINEPAR